MPLNPSTLAEARAMVGAVLEATESRKHQANDDKCLALGWVSTPLEVDSYGAWGREASNFLALVAARLAIFNLSICLIRVNARATPSKEYRTELVSIKLDIFVKFCLSIMICHPIQD